MIKLMQEIWNQPQDPVNTWVSRCMFVIGPCLGFAGMVGLAVWWVAS
jgi:hypothetical protein